MQAPPSPSPSGSGPAVIKLGGALVADPEALAPFWRDVAVLRAQAPVLVVHGGGPQATALARRLGHEPRIVHGRRVTSDLDLAIIQWTLRGELNSRLVAAATRAGLRAAGICGVDGATLRVHRRPPRLIDGETVDFGHVGDVDTLDTGLLSLLLLNGFLPIFAPLGVDDQGRVYNVNADTVACAVAGALGASRFLLVTESGGLRRDPADAASRLPVCNAALLEQGSAEGWITGGMRVKVDTALQARTAGIPDVYICAPDELLHPEPGTRIA